MRGRRVAVLLAWAGAASMLDLVAPAAAGPAFSFAPRNDYRTGLAASSLAVADLDGNGSRDLVVLNDDTFSILLNRGDGRFRKRFDYPTGDLAGSLTAGDLNGDGKPDLAVTEWRSGTVSVFLNRGGALMQQPVNYPAGPGAGGVAIGDLNGDGNLDLATSNFADGSVSVLLNRGNGTFEPERAYPTGTRPEAVATGDLNGDGRLDLATVNLDGSVSVLLNGGDGTFEPRIDYATGESPQSFALGDVNGDGRPDVATGNEKDLSVLLNRGDGSLGTKRNYRVGRFSGGVAIGDLNGDGRPDLAVTHQVNALAEVAVLLNQGDGSFLPKRDYAVGDEPEGVVIGKFDRNRLRDLATANSEAGSVTVLLNSTGGCGVPRIERKPLPAAERAIERDGCRVGRIRYVHARLQRDRVISQAPWAGRALPAGGSVDLVVSLGLER